MTEDASLATHPCLSRPFCLTSIVFAAVQHCVGEPFGTLSRQALYSSSVGIERSKVK